MPPPPAAGGMPPQNQQMPPGQQPPPPQGMGGGVGAPPMGGGYQVPQAFADPEGGSFEGGGGAGAPPTGGFPNQAAGFPPQPTGGRHVGAIPPPPGGMPGAAPGGAQPAPVAPVQFFNPAAVPARQSKAPAQQPVDPNAAPTDQMANMSMRTGPAQAFSLGDLAAGPSSWHREPATPLQEPTGQSQPRYMQVSCGAFPASAAMLQKFALPVAVNIQACVLCGVVICALCRLSAPCAGAELVCARAHVLAHGVSRVS